MAEININDWVNITLANIDKVVEYTVEGVIDNLDSNPAVVGNPTLWKKVAPLGYTAGHFRANWQLGVDSAPSGEISGTDAEGTGTVTKNKGKIPNVSAAKHNYYVVNNVPYAHALEYGNHSSQIPVGGLIAKTERDFDEIVARAVNRTIK